MKVRAKELGFYGNSRKRPGEVFELKDEKDFSEKWMQSLEGRKEAEAEPEAKAKGRRGKDAEAKSSGDADVI